MTVMHKGKPGVPNAGNGRLVDLEASGEVTAMLTTTYSTFSNFYSKTLFDLKKIDFWCD